MPNGDTGVGGNAAGADAGQGGGVGAGASAGTGGERQPAAVGDGRRGTAPEPRQLVLPPSEYPDELRGRTLDVTFWVDAAGHVQRIRVVPEIRHREFAKTFEETMRSYRFRPARSPEGAPVPGAITVRVAFFH